MGIELIEERFQQYKRKYPQNLPELALLGREISGHQQSIRKILRNIPVCAECSTSCCIGIPCDGWFTSLDYFAYRMLYDFPEALKVSSGEWRNCSFLTQAGCSLPEDMRPLPCVKVNCAHLNQVLEERGELSEFKKLCEALDDIQTRLWELVGAQEE
ncbi:MAG TPA: hypothetical protein VMX95_01030 [Thermodesulfobacteriota bacterium]|nr:hypothetical protein [Thermodesulfobacteriota bacterium]